MIAQCDPGGFVDDRGDSCRDRIEEGFYIGWHGLSPQGYVQSYY